MNTETITETARATHHGTISFADVVTQLLAAGVEYYHVDYVGMTASFYGANGACVTTPIPFEGLPAVAADFDLAALKADILDSQRHGQKYRDFTHRAMTARNAGLFRIPTRETGHLPRPAGRSAYRVVSRRRPRSGLNFPRPAGHGRRTPRHRPSGISGSTSWASRVNDSCQPM